MRIPKPKATAEQLGISLKAFERLQWATMDIAKSLPSGWSMIQAFVDAEDDADFDNDPGANYNIGFLNGTAAATDRSIDDLLDALGYTDFVGE